MQTTLPAHAVCEHKTTPCDAETDAFTMRLVAAAAHLRLPELFAGTPPGALYYLPDRHGVRVVALPTTSLNEQQLLTILRYRLAHYLLAGFLDPHLVHAAGLDHEPYSSVSPQDVHVVATNYGGDILCYAVIRAIVEPRPGTTLRSRERVLFPVERSHGWGIYNHLPLLPDLPVTRVRELGRYVKNQLVSGVAEAAVRAPIEVNLAVMRVLGTALQPQVIAVLGEFEERIAKVNLDFVHCPVVVIRGTTPREPDGSYHAQRHLQHVFRPFALLCADLVPAEPRLTAIEQALALPGDRALRALFDLKRHTISRHSSLTSPASVLPPMAVTAPHLKESPRSWTNDGSCVEGDTVTVSLPA